MVGVAAVSSVFQWVSTGEMSGHPHLSGTLILIWRSIVFRGWMMEREEIGGFSEADIKEGLQILEDRTHDAQLHQHLKVGFMLSVLCRRHLEVCIASNDRNGRKDGDW